MKFLASPFLVFFLVAAAQAITNDFSVIYCHASVSDTLDGEARLAISLPTTNGFSDTNGNPVTVWDVGSIVAGGTADTFYSENGPGAFQARNTGNRAAYVYITSGFPRDLASAAELDSGCYDNTLRGLFGDSGLYYCSAAFEPGVDPDSWMFSYRLAVSTNVTSKIPVWRNLDWLYFGGDYVDRTGDGILEEDMGYVWAYKCWMHLPSMINNRLYDDLWWDGGTSGICGQYLGFLCPGETVHFDLKFWAPRECESSIAFVVRLEASTFRRWTHGKYGK